MKNKPENLIPTNATNNRVKRLSIVFVITVIYTIAEYAGGYLTNSLALTADAGHMTGDITALATSLFALFYAKKPASSEKTYGYFRAEILAAFSNGVLLFGIAIFILYEAILRLFSHYSVNGSGMTIVAVGGLLVNISGLLILKSTIKDNLNLKSVYWHILGDLLGSVGAILAGIIIYVWNYTPADTIMSIIIACLITNGALRVLRDALHILFEGVPSKLKVKEIKEELCKLEEVEQTHDLHIWSISTEKVALSVHICSNTQNQEELLKKVRELLNKKFSISHLTVQIEPPGFFEKEIYEDNAEK